MAIDDRPNLQDIEGAKQALEKARDHLEQAMVGKGPRSREAFIFYIGMARGRLSRVASRINGETLPPHPDDQPTFECPNCHAISYNPNHIANSYCGRCHEFTP